MRFGSRLGLDDFTAHVVTTVGANRMRRQCGAALFAVGKLLRFLGIVRPAAAGAGVALSAFWNGHSTWFPLGHSLCPADRIGETANPKLPCPRCQLTRTRRQGCICSIRGRRVTTRQGSTPVLDNLSAPHIDGRGVFQLRYTRIKGDLKLLCTLLSPSFWNRSPTCRTLPARLTANRKTCPRRHTCNCPG